MIELNRTIIKNLATDELTYKRGLRYYTLKAIKDIRKTPTNTKYCARVQGKSEYRVDIDLSGKKPLYECNCPGSRKYPKACKHSIAVLLYISDFLEKNRLKNVKSLEDRSVIQVLDYFEHLEYLQGVGELFYLKPEIRLPRMLREGEDDKIYISLSAGNKRLYKIQNIRKFLTDYKTGETIVLGKDFAFFPAESRFDLRSLPILDFFIEILNIQEIAGKGNSVSFFQRAEIILDRFLFLRFLKLLQLPFSFSFGEMYFSELSFKREEPDLNFFLNLSDEDDSIILSWEKEEILPLDERGNLFFYDNSIYLTKKIFSKHFLPFYSLAKNKDEAVLSFSGEAKERFLTSVLPRIHETFHLTIPRALKDGYITADAIFLIYLSTEKDRVRLEVKVKYEDYEFNPFDKLPNGKSIIVRQPSREEECFSLIEGLGFFREGLYFYLSTEEKIYHFLTESIEEITKHHEVFYSQGFKNMTVLKPKLQKTSVRMMGDNQFLEVDFSFEGIDEEDLGKLFRSLKQKKKYFRLKNGSFIDLSDKQSLVRISELLQNSISEESLDEGKIQTHARNAFFLNDLFAEDGSLIEKDSSFEKLIQRIKNLKADELSVPKEIKAELRPYQNMGYTWLMNLKNYYLGGILADDMGLGKTLQAITYMAAVLKEEKEAVFLVVCPSSLLYNWEDEIGSFCPGLSSLIVLGSPEERKALLPSFHKHQVILISYPIIRKDIDYLKSFPFHTVFLDEAQFIKNPDSRSAKAVKKLNSQHRFALTGTPIENSLSELWSIFDFLMPGYLHSHSKFINLYEKPIIRLNDEEALKKLNFRIKPFILRRMKKDVLTELPEKIEKKMITDMTTSQKEIYLSHLQEIKEKITTEISERGFEKSRVMILSFLTRLRQICCHPSTFLEDSEADSGKLNLLLEVLENAILNGNRILIFSQFTSMLRIIEKELIKKKYKYFYLDGQTPIENRATDVKQFNSGEREVFLISLKAGGTGLNLTGADMVIHYDPWWNPAVEEQATDRVYRIGQKNNVTVIRLITKGTIEEKIYKLQEKKRNLADSVIKADEVFINKLTKEEIESLFDYS